MSDRQRIALITLLYIGLILLLIGLADVGQLSLFGIPVSQLSQAIPYFDKLGHFFLIGTLAFFVNLSLGCRRVNLGTHPVLLGSSLVFVLVVAEEFSQIYFPLRSFDWQDLLADIAGIYLFGYLAEYWQRRALLRLQQKRTSS